MSRHALPGAAGPPGRTGLPGRLGPMGGLAAVVAGLVLAGAMVATPSTGAGPTVLMATTAGLPGEVSLGHDAGTSALFRAVNLAPGATLVNCVRVSYTTSGHEQAVGFHAVVAGDGARHLGLRIEIGDGGGYGDCAGFTPERVAYEGTLAGLAAGYPDADTAMPTRVVRDTGSVSFRFRFAVSEDNAAQGTTAEAGFTWTSRGSAEPGPAVIPPALPSPSPSPSPSAPPAPAPSPAPGVTPGSGTGNGPGPPTKAAGPRGGARPAAEAEPETIWAAAGHLLAAATRRVLVPVAQAGTVGLAVYVIVFLFLLIQNRIDRRDPKLALAPVKRRSDPVFRPRSEVLP